MKNIADRLEESLKAMFYFCLISGNIKRRTKDVDLFQDFQSELLHALFRIHFLEVLPHHLQFRNHLHHHTRQVKYEMRYLYFIQKYSINGIHEYLLFYQLSEF